MNNCSSAPPRAMVTLSKSTAFRVTPGLDLLADRDAALLRRRSRR